MKFYVCDNCGKDIPERDVVAVSEDAHYCSIACFEQCQPEGSAAEGAE